MIVYTIFITIWLVFWPDNLFAWGPGTHLEIASDLVNEAAKFSPVVASLMKKFRDEYIYGMISADLLCGKKYAGYLHHCHNWSVGWKVLENCESDREMASAYGYLTHLAADIVAHNYYVPFMLIKSFDEDLLHHTYWELRFDMHVKPETWDEARRIITGDFAEFDSLLKATLKRPLFSFRTNKNIFSTIVLVQQLKQLRQTVLIHSRFARWPLTNDEVGHYKTLAMDVARDFLVNLENAECMKGEASGTRRLKYADGMRKSLMKLYSRGVVDLDEIEVFIEKIKRSLRENIFNPDADLPDSYEAL